MEVSFTAFDPYIVLAIAPHRVLMELRRDIIEAQAYTLPSSAVRNQIGVLLISYLNNDLP